MNSGLHLKSIAMERSSDQRELEGLLGVEVKCQKELSQSLNRYHARVLLVKKIDQMIRGRESEERQEIEKIRRQKRKRSKRAKEKMLAEKKVQSQKKKLRSGRINMNE